MKNRTSLLLLSFLMLIMFLGVDIKEVNASTYVDMPDANLRKVVNNELGYGRTTKQITKKDMEKLKNISCDDGSENAGIKNLKGLEYAKNIDHICLNSNEISDISPLAGLTKIKNLYIGNNNIKDITPIKNMKSLQEFTVWTNQVENISVLSDKTNIYYLLLSTNKIKNISPLTNLSKLVELDLYKNSISDISALKNKPYLEILEINNNLISDLTPISGSTKMKTLKLHSNKIEDLTPLKNMKELGYLHLSQNLKIRNLTPLSNLKKLYHLGLVNNDIYDVTPLKGLTNLEYLTLSDNHISDVSSLTNLKKLSQFNINGNHVSDLSMIYNMNIKNIVSYGQTITLPDAYVGDSTPIKIEPSSKLNIKFNGGTGTYKNGQISWNSVNGDGEKTITFSSKESTMDFSGTITQKVKAHHGEVNITAFEILGDDYFGEKSNKFFEGDKVTFRFTAQYLSEKENSYSGPIKVKLTGDGFEETITMKKIDLPAGWKTYWHINNPDNNENGHPVASFEHEIIAEEIAGKDFNEIKKSLTLEVIPTKAGIKQGASAKKTVDYYSVNKVYDISVDEIISHDEYPVPGDETNVKLMICNNGNQDFDGYTTEIIYNEQKMTTLDIGKLERGAYVSPNEVDSNCTGVSINTEVPELYDPNAFVDFKATVTPKVDVTELTTDNNHISATFEQGVGPEPIYVCDASGELIDIVYDEKDIKNGSPENCKDETGQIDPGPDVGEPITEVITEVPLDEEYFYEPVDTKPVNAPIAKQVSGTDFKEEVENIFVQVNRAGKHPKDDIDKSNDKKLQKFKSVNKVYDLSAVQVTKIDPSVPKSNEDVKVKVKICNEGNQNILDYTATVNYKNENRISGTGEYTNLSRGPYNNIDTIPNCKEITVDTKMFDIEDPEESFLSRVIVQPKLPSGEAEKNTINNITTFDTLVRNPNASVFVRNTNDNKDVISETGGVSVVVNNNMFRNISAPCEGDCLSTSNTTGHIKITDMLNGGVINIPITFNDLEHGKQKVVDVSKPILNYIKGLENKDYEVIEFKIEARIPHYKHEVDYSGQPKYDDNVVVDTIHYFPPRPNVSIMKCTELGNPTGYFTMDGGNGPIKTCAGHYPNNPSTAIEGGMQAYHYVMHRFFPAPMPKYEIKTPAADEKHSPHYFNQIYKLEEPVNEMGDEDTFLFANKDANGIWKERGRYLPTGATFNFEVKEKQEDGRIIAAGSIHYDIPNGCYQTETLDMKHQYGCDEIMFFVPNVDNKDNFVKEPKDYEGNVSYPLGGEDNATTKIPYLNPGLYEFKVEAEESFEYHYQVNNGIDNEYYWGKVKK